MSRSQFTRAFLRGQLYQKGRPISTAVIRERFGVSPATAKRDMRKVRELQRAVGREVVKRRVQSCAHCGGHSVATVSEP